MESCSVLLKEREKRDGGYIQIIGNKVILRYFLHIILYHKLMLK